MGDIVSAKFKPKQKKYELESAPGGWVSIRRMNHGEATERFDTIVAFQAGPTSGTSVRSLSQWRARLFDFEHCIVDHNLGDAETGLKFDFSKPQDVADLEEEIGDEIQRIINQHHGRQSSEESEADESPETDPNS